MPILDDYECEKCGCVIEAWRDEPNPSCCKRDMRRLLPLLRDSGDWGGPRVYRELRDEPFRSRSELQAWAKERNLEPCGDKVGGARNEDHRGLGKLFSYKGSPKRTSELSRRSGSAYR